MAKYDPPSFTDQASLARGDDTPRATPEIAKAAPIPAVVAMQDLPPPSPEAPPVGLFSGVAAEGLPSSVWTAGHRPGKPIPGHELYWFSDENGLMISNAGHGLAVCQTERIALNEALTSPEASTMIPSRHWVGSGANNNPEFNYLMKIPVGCARSLWQEREHPQRQEEQLAMGTYGADRYRPYVYRLTTLPKGGTERTLRPSVDRSRGRYYRPPQPDGDSRGKPGASRPVCK